MAKLLELQSSKQIHRCKGVMAERQPAMESIFRFTIRWMNESFLRKSRKKPIIALCNLVLCKAPHYFSFVGLDDG